MGWLKKINGMVGSVAGLVVVYVLLRKVFGPIWLVNIIGSLALAGICILVFRVLRHLKELVKVLLAMWLPITVTALAGILLFYEGQGRDLGVGLLGEGLTKLVLLFFVLVYWAVNNWHSARLGLDYAFPTPTGGERWLFWPPRLLGVCAHCFAAVSLAMACWGLTSFTKGSSSIVKLPDLLVFTAPIVIVLVTASVWAFDYSVISQRQGRPLNAMRFARWIRVLAPLGAGALIIGLGFASYYGSLPEGLFPGTLSISASACLFLLIISLRRRTVSNTPNAHAGFTVGLAMVAIAMGVAIWCSPNRVGDALGSLNVCFFGFGAALAVLNLIGLLGSLFIERNSAMQRAKFAVSAIAFLMLLAAFTSALRDFHRVRLCAGDDCSLAPSFQGWSSIKVPAARPTVAEAALAWYEQAAQAYRRNPAHAGKPVPMVVVATAGGGIRAAYWTATVLERLEGDLKGRGEALENLVFAVSGVSGGSVGAMEYVAALHERAAVPGSEAKPTAYLQSDFLAGAIASLVFIDGPSNFLPDLGQVDRGTALERSFETGSGGYLAHSFLSFFPDAATARKHWRPALLLNATHEETGRRIIGSNLTIERDVFLDSFDEFDLVATKSDPVAKKPDQPDTNMRASTVAHNSARFTYVSPAGKLEPNGGNGFLWGETNRGYVIDGGYFENYGALTALEVAREARTQIENVKGRGAVKLVVLLISSDPSLTKQRTRVRTRDDASGCVLTTGAPASGSGGGANFLQFVDSGRDKITHRWEKNDGEGLVVSYLNELAAPLQGVTAVREAHGTLAAAELAATVCTERNALHGFAESAASSPPAINDLLAVTKVQATTAMPRPPSSVHPGSEPLFVHLAMCDVSDIQEAPIVPPLGWALSKPMREKFPDILKDCGNPDELGRIERALD